MTEHWKDEEERIAYVKKMADISRFDLVAMLAFCGSGHPGGSLSIIEILASLYHGGIMKYNPANPGMPDRDRLVVSKGHASPALYVVLGNLGYFDKQWLRELEFNGSNLPKHCDRLATPGVEASTGALGQGFSISVGMALKQKMDAESHDVYCIVGDGECQSGQAYEAAMSAGHFRLGSLNVILDYNDLQVDGRVSDVMSLGDIRGVWEALGWRVTQCDGHNIAELLDAFDMMKKTRDKPKLLIADTVKGKGVSFMENNGAWHSAKIPKDKAGIAMADVGRCLVPCDREILARFLSREELRDLCNTRDQ